MEILFLGLAAMSGAVALTIGLGLTLTRKPQPSARVEIASPEPLVDPGAPVAVAGGYRFGLEANGHEVFTPQVLEADRRYRLRFEGTVSRRFDQKYSADAWLLTDRFGNFTEKHKGPLFDNRPLAAPKRRLRLNDRANHVYELEIDGRGQRMGISLRTPFRYAEAEGFLFVTVVVLDGVPTLAEEAAAAVLREKQEAVARAQAKVERRRRQQDDARIREEEGARALAERRRQEAHEAGLREEEAGRAAERTRLAERERRQRRDEKVLELLQSTLPLRNFEDRTYVDHYALTHQKDLILRAEEVRRNLHKLRGELGSEFMAYVETEHPKLFARLTGEFEALLAAERQLVKPPPPPRPVVVLQARESSPPIRQRLTPEEYRERLVRRVLTKAADNLAVMGAINSAIAALRGELEGRELPEHEVESQVDLLRAQLTPVVDQLVEGGSRNAPGRILS